MLYLHLPFVMSFKFKEGVTNDIAIETAVKCIQNHSFEELIDLLDDSSFHINFIITRYAMRYANDTIIVSTREIEHRDETRIAYITEEAQGQKTIFGKCKPYEAFAISPHLANPFD